ncbi:hypothetical protein Q4S45_10165 [Massilia sp. R2A-15]|uniref:hypothetical protein n=1 Tax=Massilia sp. R2A-15 TaxID=3064278 RepID=UPI002732E320|nr:hypothetical protein [Massilia sp. R2A-15]WLI91460.1 hypothetical protein Q4S45_10165 [Massilia sp. R2A-15]
MNDFDFANRPGEQRQFRSLSERKLAESLSCALSAPLSWTQEQDSIRVVPDEGEGSFGYRPDFLIRNDETGRLLAVELKASQGLSRANLMKFKLISDAYHKAGKEFLLIVDGAQDGSAVRALNQDNVRTAWLSDESAGTAVETIRRALMAAF